MDAVAFSRGTKPELQAALKQVLIVGADVPFTDGYRRKLRHEGHNLNVRHGLLKTFSTCNFGDTYSAIVFMLARGDTGNEILGQRMQCILSSEEPSMPTLQEMHKLVARSPRAQAKFYLLMDDIVERQLYGTHQSYVGKHCLTKSIHC